MRKERAEEIGQKLNETKKWHTHSRGISMQVLRKSLNLEIEDFGKKNNVNKLIKIYYKLLNDYMVKRGVVGLVHVKEEFKPIFMSR